ncbi:MAG: heme-binding protein, partial [Candidatus Thiodiazotropha sp.]
MIAEPGEESTLYRFRTLSLELASKATWGAIETCRQRGYSVAVAVVDRGGNVQAQLRDRFAGPHTPETALRKAWTANSFRQSTAELAGMLE